MIKPMRSILQLQRHADGTTDWFHLSISRPNYMLRQLIGPNDALREAHYDAVAAINQLLDTYELVIQLKVSTAAQMANYPTPPKHEDFAAWWNIKLRCEQGQIEQPQEIAAAIECPGREQRLLRFTQLRSLYHLLRKIPSIEFHSAIADGLNSNCAELIALVDRSLKKMLNYQNLEHLLKTPRRPLQPPPARITKDRHLIAALQQHDGHGSVKGPAGLDFTLIEREVSPLRTTNGRWESGAKATNSGGGGIDGLLLCNEDNFPIVGEIKVGSDATPLLALIQALTYAIELSTPNQYGRLRTWLTEMYDRNIPAQSDPPRVDIYLILVDYPDDVKHARCLRLTHGIVQRMYDVHRDILPAGFPRRIVCLNTEFVPGNVILRFRTRFAYGIDIPGVNLL